MRSLWAPFAEEQSGSFSYPGTTIDMPPAPLRTEWVSVFSNPYSGAMSGDEEGIFCTPNCFAVLFWTKFQLFLRASLQGGKIMAQIVSTVTWPRRTFSQQLVILALNFLTMLNTLQVVMTMTTTFWNSGRGSDRHTRAEKLMLVLLMSTLCVRMSVGIGRCHHCLSPHRCVKSCFCGDARGACAQRQAWLLCPVSDNVDNCFSEGDGTNHSECAL